MFDNRPFKFEKYRIYEELNTALKKEFPVGSDIKKIISILEKSGARCKDRSHEEVMKEEVEIYGLVYWCEYENG
ncbi:MAG: hypothetical protein AB8U25_04000 [Rickettsiales endosymbiont of Dermacentor nuttalli]